jgi:hypothetical protein
VCQPWSVMLTFRKACSRLRLNMAPAKKAY